MSRRILLLGTGGTISCGGSDKGLAPQNDVRQLLSLAGISGTGAELCAELRAEQLFMLDSTNITPRHCESMARRIAEDYDAFDGFVILHGTDTMAFSAAALYCLIQYPAKPIVLTGSMKPMTAAGSDAPGNLRDALNIALSDKAHGVMVMIGGRLIDGRCARKIHTRAAEAFESVGAPYRDPENFPAHSGETRFYDRLDDGVFTVRLFPGQQLSVPRFEGLKAVIIEGFGAGGVPEYCMDEVRRLREEGVYVVIATQVPYGGTDLCEYEVGRAAADELGLYQTRNATPEYAAARAMQLLAAGERWNGAYEL